ncbi:MAG: SPOR domain-containing protein [Hyphomicrobiales bacterium]
MKFRLLLIIGFIAISQLTKAQAPEQGALNVIADDKIEKLINLDITMNKKYKRIPGYRIQIFFDSGNNSKSRAMNVANKFKGSHPKTPCYIDFAEPNFRVRVGDYRTKLDAEYFLRKIQYEYPNAWITSDKINYPLLGDERLAPKISQDSIPVNTENR